MIEHRYFTPAGAETSWLYVAELLHRVRNEYATTIALATVAATRSSCDETRTALGDVIDRLHALAEAHRVMQPPAANGRTDFAGHLTQICQAMMATGLQKRGISLNLEIPHSVPLDAARCWRAGLVVAELITNAARHAFSARAGGITVSLAADRRITCQVRDDGSPSSALRPGLGTHLVDALAAELDGHVERILGPVGMTVTLSFPADQRPVMDRTRPAHAIHSGSEQRV